MYLNIQLLQPLRFANYNTVCSVNKGTFYLNHKMRLDTLEKWDLYLFNIINPIDPRSYRWRYLFQDLNKSSLIILNILCLHDVRKAIMRYRLYWRSVNQTPLKLWSLLWYHHWGFKQKSWYWCSVCWIGWGTNIEYSLFYIHVSLCLWNFNSSTYL